MFGLLITLWTAPPRKQHRGGCSVNKASKQLVAIQVQYKCDMDSGTDVDLAHYLKAGDTGVGAPSVITAKSNETRKVRDKGDQAYICNTTAT